MLKSSMHTLYESAEPSDRLATEINSKKNTQMYMAVPCKTNSVIIKLSTSVLNNTSVFKKNDLISDELLSTLNELITQPHVKRMFSSNIRIYDKTANTANNDDTVTNPNYDIYVDHVVDMRDNEHTSCEWFTVTNKKMLLNILNEIAKYYMSNLILCVLDDITYYAETSVDEKEAQILTDLLNSKYVTMLVSKAREEFNNLKLIVELLNT